MFEDPALLTYFLSPTASARSKGLNSDLADFDLSRETISLLDCLEELPLYITGDLHLFDFLNLVSLLLLSAKSF